MVTILVHAKHCGASLSQRHFFCVYAFALILVHVSVVGFLAFTMEFSGNKPEWDVSEMEEGVHSCVSTLGRGRMLSHWLKPDHQLIIA